MCTAPAQAQAGLSPEQIEARFRVLEDRIKQLEAELAEVKGEPAPEPEPAAPAVTQFAPEPEPAPLPMAEVIPTEGTESADFYSGEVRMPLSGYMDFHLNKPQGEPGTADFHRFVLLFGHSFNKRIQFWSELEIEHAFVSGEEVSGEIELEQAYLDFSWS